MWQQGVGGARIAQDFQEGVVRDVVEPREHLEVDRRGRGEGGGRGEERKRGREGEGERRERGGGRGEGGGGRRRVEGGKGEKKGKGGGEIEGKKEGERRGGGGIEGGPSSGVTQDRTTAILELQRRSHGDHMTHLSLGEEVGREGPLALLQLLPHPAQDRGLGHLPSQAALQRNAG